MKEKVKGVCKLIGENMIVSRSMIQNKERVHEILVLVVYA